MTRHQKLCPCEKKCAGLRKDAVNLVVREGVITSNELKNLLLTEIGQGEAVARKSLGFLHHKGKEGCEYVEVLKKCRGKRDVLHFRGRNRVFHLKTIEKDKIYAKVRSLLTDNQRLVLRAFEQEMFGTYYLSSYELRKLIPIRANYIEFSLEKLLDIGFVKEMRVTLPLLAMHTHKVWLLEEIAEAFEKGTRYPFSFYTNEKNEKRLRDRWVEAIIDEMSEFEVIKQVQLQFMRIYPFGLVKSFKGTIRTKDKDRLRLSRARSFDLCCPLAEPVGGKRFIGVDVYTRFPVNEEVARFFHRKIRFGQDFGMIYGKSVASSRTLYFCKDRNIHLERLKDIGVDCDTIRRSVERKVKDYLLDGHLLLDDKL